MGVEVEIAAVTACDCPAHARVVLRDEARGRKLQVRIHADAGQALLAEMAGVTSTRSLAIDMLGEALSAAGGNLEYLTLSCSDGQLCARLCVRGQLGWSEIDTEPCEALLAACRMKLPVFVEEVGAPTCEETQVPEVYREAVESLDFSGLSGEGA